MPIIKRIKLGANAVEIKHKELLAERDHLNAKLAENAAALQDCAAAARLFGVELAVEPDLFIASSNGQVAAIEVKVGATKGEQSIRELTLDLLKHAGDKGSKASPIRRAIEASMGRELHYKTIGMTLYRLSEKGLVRRDGFTWFITPEGMRA